MKREYTKKEYRQILSMDLTESALVRKKMQGAYKKIKMQERSERKVRQIGRASCRERV